MMLAVWLLDVVLYSGQIMAMNNQLLLAALHNKIACTVQTTSTLMSTAQAINAPRCLLLLVWHYGSANFDRL